mmetsp:Transcript_8809/g.8705  ORF Transcript_8809/g.8705 Transcript_8809/m.8705 type:complete len:621 (+) Transcript_8809:44-1906(+)
MSVEGASVGIDLGTTYSCVGVWQNDRVEIIANDQGNRTTPSYVAFNETERLIGDAAKNQVAMNASNTVFDAKRLIGRKFGDAAVQADMKHWPFTVIEGPAGKPIIQVTFKGEVKQFASEEISSMVLMKMKEIAEAYLGREVKNAVVTVPAYFNDSQRQATKDAGVISGLNVLRIINEPTAAAIAYGLDKKGAEKNVLIFDLGGGTFDVSVLSMEGGVFAVKATGGDTHLGGEDFDNILVDWCLKQIEDKSGKNAAKAVKASQRSQQRLRKAVEAAKRNLSTANDVDIEVESLVDGANFSVKLTRAAFEKLCAPLFVRCIDTVKSVIRDAGATLELVTDVVLVGGSTRVPALQSQLLALFDGRIELCKSINPDEAVAYGAAVQGAILKSGGTGGGAALDGISSDIVLLDVTPLSLGIELEGKVMSVLIPRNTPIPCVKSREYTTCEDFQTEIDVVVFEGERPQTSANNKLGDFKISGVQRAKRGEPKVEVTFSLDANGILSVTAMDKVTGAQANAEIKADRGRLTDAEIDRMIADAERYREEDMALARKIHLRNALEEAVYGVKTSLTERNDIAGISELDDILTWLEYDSETATHEEIQRKADEMQRKFGVRVDATSRHHA